MRTTTLRASIFLGLMATSGRADEPDQAVAIRATRPDEQARAVLGLFRGSKAFHPAAALSAWKRASREPSRLGKPLEALIAAFNPAMADEARTLDGAEVALGFGAGDGRPSWRAVLLRDDGTFGALATALVLSGGAAEPPIGGIGVDRLGPPGSPLMARRPEGLVIAGARDGLKGGFPEPDFPRPVGPGLDFRVDAGPLGASNSVAARRVGEGLRAAGCPAVEGRLALEGSGLVGLARFAVEAPAAGPRGVDPTWLDWVPEGRAMAAFAVAVPSGDQARDSLFGLVDRVERVDPARRNLAPSRLRLELAARSVGVRPEADILPHLRGVSGWVGPSPAASPVAFLMLHLDDEAVAARVVDRARPPGSVDGRPLRLARAGPSVMVAWGEGALEASESARADPGRSAGAALRSDWGDRPPGSAGGFWPGRCPAVAEAGSPLARAFDDASPSTWQGRWDGKSGLVITLAWPGLDRAVRRFLEEIPLDSPPDR